MQILAGDCSLIAVVMPAVAAVGGLSAVAVVVVARTDVLDSECWSSGVFQTDLDLTVCRR